MESNVLCSILVLMFTVPKEQTAVLCTLDYTDHTRCLPTRVHFECEGRIISLINPVFKRFDYKYMINLVISYLEQHPSRSISEKTISKNAL